MHHPALPRMTRWLALAVLGASPTLLGAADATGAPGQPSAASDRPDMTWFTDARLGIFIHWGVYSEGKGSESWAFHDGDMPYDTYIAQAKTFTAANYQPERWAELFSAAGARYAVLTSKHHDGFALWDTAQSRLNAKDGSPAGRDLVGPFCAAMRKEGLRVGLYFSHLDWSHPDYASVFKEGGASEAERKNRFSYPQGPENPAAWERFLAFHRAQLKEITERYRPDCYGSTGTGSARPRSGACRSFAASSRNGSPASSSTAGWPATGTMPRPSRRCRSIPPRARGSSA